MATITFDMHKLMQSGEAELVRSADLRKIKIGQSDAPPVGNFEV
jgi:hypothetical protein